MAIDFRKYVDITSAVGGGVGVRQRDLITRIFTTNELLPTNSFVEMTSADDVATYFGATSEEAERANFYFGFISKRITRANRISYARYTPTATAPQIFGAPGSFVVADFTPISTGQFTLQMGAVIQLVSGIDLSSAASLADVASTMQVSIRAANVDANFATALVTYDAVARRFNLTGGAMGVADIAVTIGATQDVAGPLGWLSSSARLSDGAAATGSLETFQTSIEASNNLGSFLFQQTLTIDEIEALANFNQTRNVEFMYLVPVDEANETIYSTRLISIGGTTVTLEGSSGSLANDAYHEMVPGIVLASTDYNIRNSVQNYMFQILDITPTVTTTARSNSLDDIRINYYGNTQTAGQILQFYQRGVMMGQGTDIVDQNVYANEIWLKDFAASQIMSQLLSQSRIPANPTGEAIIRSTLQVVINDALFNGTISVGRPINNTQRQFILQVTGDENAFIQIRDKGYFLDTVIQSTVTTDGRTEFQINYTLIYTKDDAVRRVEGTHILI